jgi:hypothetical protein
MKCSPKKAHVLKAWFPMQCSKVGLLKWLDHEGPDFNQWINPLMDSPSGALLGSGGN